MHTTKSACDSLLYRRNQKYFRTLNSVAQNFRTRKTKTTIFQDFGFCFFKLAEALRFYFPAPRNAELNGTICVVIFGKIAKRAKKRNTNCVQPRKAWRV